MEELVLVDSRGGQIGTAEKVQTHKDGGRLHLAFSVFVFNRRHELLVQRRAAVKYHFSQLWSNTCCGHPRPEEDVVVAAGRRLDEEFGFSVKLRRISTITYTAFDEKSRLTENEFVHVLVGHHDGDVRPDPMEIDQFRWQSVDRLLSEIESSPGTFTPWFRLMLQQCDFANFKT